MLLFLYLINPNGIIHPSRNTSGCIRLIAVMMIMANYRLCFMEPNILIQLICVVSRSVNPCQCLYEYISLYWPNEDGWQMIPFLAVIASFLHRMSFVIKNSKESNTELFIHLNLYAVDSDINVAIIFQIDATWTNWKKNYLCEITLLCAK